MLRHCGWTGISGVVWEFGVPLEARRSLISRNHVKWGVRAGRVSYPRQGLGDGKRLKLARAACMAAQPPLRAISVS